MSNKYCLLRWNKIHDEKVLSEKMDILIRMASKAPT